MQRTLASNVILRELDVSYNSLSSNAMINLFEGMVENFTIRKLCLRGNFMDDDAAEAFKNFLLYNNVVEVPSPFLRSGKNSIHHARQEIQ